MQGHCALTHDEARCNREMNGSFRGKGRRALSSLPNQGLGGGMKYAQGSRAARARLFESTSLHYVYSNPAARLPAHAGAVE